MNHHSEKVAAILEPFRKGELNRQTILSLEGCVHCGLCSDTCHYYRATRDHSLTPAFKADKVRKLYKYYKGWRERRLPEREGGPPLEDEGELETMKEVVFGSCSMCQRCTLHCPCGVDRASLVRLMRGLLTKQGIAPQGLLSACQQQWESGNQMGISKADYLETLEWIEEEVRTESKDPSVRIPVDKEGADFVYVVNPREIKFAPLSFMAAVKIFHVAKADWTMPSMGWDTTNFGLFSGQDDLGAHMGKLAFDQAIGLKVRRMVASECGHGFRSLKWEVPNWAKMDLPFSIHSLLEVMADWVQGGKLVLDPTRNPEPVTYHSRNGRTSARAFSQSKASI